MADGHLNKCKVCTRKDTADRVDLLSKTDIGWVEAELKRQREKSALSRLSGRRPDKLITVRGKIAWQQRNKHKRTAHGMVQKAVKTGRLTRQPCAMCGATSTQAHHDDYSKPLDVRWLCVKHHAEVHRQINAKRRLAQFSPTTSYHETIS
jgi:ribosomal protein S27AE